MFVSGVLINLSVKCASCRILNDLLEKFHRLHFLAPFCRVSITNKGSILILIIILEKMMRSKNDPLKFSIIGYFSISPI